MILHIDYTNYITVVLFCVYNILLNSVDLQIKAHIQVLCFVL